jgi:hypothetical protein
MERRARASSCGLALHQLRAISGEQQLWDLLEGVAVGTGIGREGKHDIEALAVPRRDRGVRADRLGDLLDRLVLPADERDPAPILQLVADRLLVVFPLRRFDREAEGVGDRLDRLVCPPLAHGVVRVQRRDQRLRDLELRPELAVAGREQRHESTGPLPAACQQRVSGLDAVGVDPVWPRGLPVLRRVGRLLSMPDDEDRSRRHFSDSSSSTERIPQRRLRADTVRRCAMRPYAPGSPPQGRAPAQGRDRQRALVPLRSRPTRFLRRCRDRPRRSGRPSPPPSLVYRAHPINAARRQREQTGRVSKP